MVEAPAPHTNLRGQTLIAIVQGMVIKALKVIVVTAMCSIHNLITLFGNMKGDSRLQLDRLRFQ